MITLTKETILHCPRCGEVMIPEKTKDKLPFWRCPKCGGEFWDDESKVAEIEYKERARVAYVETRQQILMGLGWRYTVVLPAGPPKPGSGNKSGRKRKKKIRKPLITERYILW